MYGLFIYEWLFGWLYVGVKFVCMSGCCKIINVRDYLSLL